MHCLKFDNNNGIEIVVLSKLIIYGSLEFDLKSLSYNIFKLGVAQINKGWLWTRLHN
jgi:hypothetical protein